jgi:hypothetical protein
VLPLVSLTVIVAVVVLDEEAVFKVITPVLLFIVATSDTSELNL